MTNLAAILAPAVATLICNRIMRPTEFEKGSVDGQLEFHIRRTVATMLGINFCDFGLAIDDLIKVRAEDEDYRLANDVTLAAYLLERTEAWGRN